MKTEKFTQEQIAFAQKQSVLQDRGDRGLPQDGNLGRHNLQRKKE